MKKTVDEVFSLIHNRSPEAPYGEDEFRADAIEAVGISGHPKADRAYALAWQQGHSYGLHDVLCALVDLASLLVDEV
jgi:hypothetical protein